MTLQVDCERLAAAHLIVRRQLLAERSAPSHWSGELSSSPLSTATAISALVLAEQGGTSSGLPVYTPGEEPSHAHEIYRGDLSELILQSVRWLAEQQNEDGGWGDTDRSVSNIATTMLVQAAFHLTGVPAKYGNLLQRSQEYVDSQGGVTGLKRRYEGDKTFAVPILTNCALADMVPWRKVPALPFELASLPQRWYHLLNLPVVSYAIPALVAVGQAKFHHAPPRNPLVRWLRASARKRTLGVLTDIQPASGGFLEATPLTSFVVMSLASIGLDEHPVVRRGIEFLLMSVRPDGSWPIDSNLATWNTSQALTALNWNLSDQLPAATTKPTDDVESALDWLLNCQHTQRHPFTGAAAGGWAWTDLSGGVPDADDTSAALCALSAWQRRWPQQRGTDVKRAARAGIHWLLGIQNSDGGWPTFCRGWGKLQFDRSSCDITAHALRGIYSWRGLLQIESVNTTFIKKIEEATRRGLQFISQNQQPDGSWMPLWFGNQWNAQEANPVYGTAKVLTMCHELGIPRSEMAQRGLLWLVNAQHAAGGWGVVGPVTKNPADQACSVEETALATESMLQFSPHHPLAEEAAQQGVSWLIEAIESGRHLEPAAIGFYFSKLWYYERLYPQIFATSVLARANRACHAVSQAAGVM